MEKKSVHVREQPAGEVKSAVRVLELLELLASVGEALGVSDVARTLDLPKSSAHMLLASLESRGYVVDDGMRRFALHPALRGDGQRWAGGFRGALLRAARPAMQQLADASHESVLLAVLRPDLHMEYIEKVVSRSELRIDTTLGTPKPLHATSAGLVLLAWSDESVRAQYLARAPFQKFTARTIETAAALKRELALVQRRGHAIIKDAHSAHASGMAAPVREAGGKLAGALTLAAPTSRFNAATAVAGLVLLKQAAAEASRALGFDAAPAVLDPEALQA